MRNGVKRIPGGVHPDPRKRTENLETVVMPLPAEVVLPMQQHIGAPCEPTVKKGDRVCVGQVVGAPTDRLAVPIHASVSGTVKAVGPRLYAGGRHITSVQIEADGEQTLDPALAPVSTRDPAGMIASVRDSGIVGLGGAGFPTWYKLTPPPGSTFDTLVVNGAECEPYITSDYREMVEEPIRIIRGIKLVQQMTGIRRVLIGIEDNKAHAIDRLIHASERDSEIDVLSLRTRYPQGGERQLIYAVCGRIVPAGQLPSAVGVLVLSVNTISAIAEWFETGMPLTSRRVTCDGGVVAEPQNVRVPVGTRLGDVFDFCGGFTSHPAKVIMGGPMMGVSQFSLDNTVLKQTNALLALAPDEINQDAESVCIRCGRCVTACPMRLMPSTMNRLILDGKSEEAAAVWHLNDCIECGCCSYICPAARNLVQSFRYGKAEVRLAERRAAQAAAAAGEEK